MDGVLQAVQHRGNDGKWDNNCHQQASLLNKVALESIALEMHGLMRWGLSSFSAPIQRHT